MVSIATWSLLLLAGLSSAAEVYKGYPARIEDYPSIVQVENRVAVTWVQTCVASVLTSRHVLTVAHCFVGPLVDNYPDTFRRIRAGSGERGRDGLVIGVYKVVRHPSFGGQVLDGDLAVVSLNAGLSFSSKIQPARVTSAGVYFPANVPVTIAGWGRTAQEGIWADRELRTINLYTFDHAACADKYNNLVPDSIAEHLPIEIPNLVSENMVCLAVPGGEGTEVGIRDGGAPVYYDGVLVGLVAFGSPYGKSYPLVTTAVSPYSKWIVETASYY